MFRDERDIYHVADGIGGKHTDTVIRPQKNNQKIKSMKNEIFWFTNSIIRLRRKEKKGENHSEEIARLEHKILILKCDIKRIEEERPSTATLKPSFKKMKPEKIEAHVRGVIEDAKKRDISFINAEDIAYSLHVKPHFVKQVLDKLNKEGLVSQPVHRIPHDCNRDPICGPGYNGWAADIYYILDKKEGKS